MSRAVALVVLGLVVSGCAHSTGALGEVDQSRVVMRDTGARVVRRVQVEYAADRLLGIAIDDPDLHQHAMRALRAKAQLEGAQAFGRITVDRVSRGLFPVYWTEAIVVSADVVEFGEPAR